jgi:uncharacterized SAM-binding protein YcdF (DUF218 family)
MVLSIGLLAFPYLPDLLSRSDQLPPTADALYVFPGKLETRAKCSARLFRQGLAPLVVFTGSRIRPELRAIGMPYSDAELGAKLAARAGVPTSAEIIIPAGRSTWADAAAVSQWAQQTGNRRIIAVTSPSHARRAGESLRIALEPLGGKVWVTTCERSYSDISGWWWHEKPLIEVTNETIKLGLYLFKYFLPSWLSLTPDSPPAGVDPQPAPSEKKSG